MADLKGKGKAVEEAPQEEVDDEAEDGEAVQWHAEEGAAQQPPPKKASKEPKPTGPPRNGDWEAIFSPQYNAYYFHNIKTNETTWTNPITTEAKPAPKKDPRAILQGVDPDLAYLDPNLAAGLASASSSGTVAGQAYAAAGRFNARTGKFEGDPSRNPDFVSDYSRAKRQSNIYFDTDAWEKQRLADQEAAKANPEVKKRKPTKKELAMYKEKAAQKKKDKLSAWFYND